MDNTDKYKNICQQVSKALPQKSKQEQQKEANRLWEKVKRKEVTYESVLEELLRKTMESKSKMSFWSRATASSAASSTDENLHISENCVPSVITADNNATAANIVENMASSVSSNDQNTPSAAECNTTITQTPQQDKLQSEIAQLQEQLLALVHVRRAGLITDELVTKTKFLEKELKLKRNSLKRFKREVIRQRRRRANLKRTLDDIVDEQPSLKKAEEIH